MAISRPSRLPASRRTLSLAIGAILALTLHLRAADDPKKLPEGYSEITKAHLIAKVPSFFYFEYNFEPMPGKRLWLRIDDKHFVERYPDGSESRFRIVGHAKVQGLDGTVVVKIEGDPDKTFTDNEGGFHVFIPDKGNPEMALMFKNGDGPWSEIGLTIIHKVE